MQGHGDDEAGTAKPIDLFEPVRNKYPEKVAESLIKCLKTNDKGEIIKTKLNGNHGIFKCTLSENWNNGDMQLEKGDVVAMKLFHNSNAAEEEYSIPAFHTHKNIVTVFSLTDDIVFSDPCYIMEYSERSLGEFLHNKCNKEMYPSGESGYSLQHCIGFLKQIASALEFLHEEGIMHGDVKSINILLFDDNTVCKLCDFDHSQYINSIDSKKDCGTTGYMAPEIGGKLDACFPPRDSNSSADTSTEAVDGPAYDEKIDNYSFGVLMLELSFRSDVGGLAANVVQNYDKPGPGPFRESIFTELQDFNHSFNKIICNLLKRDPKERPSFKDVGEVFNEMNTSPPMPLRKNANVQDDENKVKNRSQISSEKIIEYTISRADLRELTDEDVKNILYQLMKVDNKQNINKAVGDSLTGDEQGTTNNKPITLNAKHQFRIPRKVRNAWIMKHKIAGPDKALVFNYCYNNNEDHCKQLDNLFEGITFKVVRRPTDGTGEAVQLIDVHQKRSQRNDQGRI